MLHSKFNFINMVAILAIIISLTSCTDSQIPFDSVRWKENHSLRFSMSESLINKLNKEKPDRKEIINLLGGKQDLDFFKSDSIEYFLKSEALVGLAYACIVIDFKDDKFEAAYIAHPD